MDIDFFSPSLGFLEPGPFFFFGHGTFCNCSYLVIQDETTYDPGFATGDNLRTRLKRLSAGRKLKQCPLARARHFIKLGTRIELFIPNFPEDSSDMAEKKKETSYHEVKSK